MEDKQELFKSLLDRLEGQTIDFKQAFYDFSGDERGFKRADFVKDLLSFYNTPRTCSAYIVFGVEARPDGRNELHGLQMVPDEAELQRQLEGTVAPVPPFTLVPVKYENRLFAFIEIPVDLTRGPCFPGRDLGALRRNQLYVRRGSQNVVADAAEQRAVHEWFSSAAHAAATPSIRPWSSFVTDVELLNPQSPLLLITGPVGGATSGSLGVLGCLPLLFVVDLDPASEEQGLLKAARGELEERRTLHLMGRGQVPTFHVGRSTYWFPARGMGPQSPDASLGFREWQRLYDRELRAMLSELAAALSRRPVQCIVLLDSDTLSPHAEVAVAAMSAELGDTVSFFGVSADSSRLGFLERLYEGTLYEMPVAEFASGVAAEVAGQVGTIEGVQLPTQSGAPATLAPKDVLWIEEDVTLVGLRTGLAEADGRQSGRDFLRGGEVTWFELANHYDAPRDGYRDLHARVLLDLQNRNSTRVMLFHEPGAGGTTMARRLAWDVHEDFPTAVVAHCDPDETAERIAKLYSTTGQSVLLIVEGDRIDMTSYDALYRQLEGRNMPFVMLYTQRRRRDSTQRAGSHSFRLPSQLSTKEATLLAQKLGDQVPERREMLLDEAKHPLPAFILSLSAFEEDFVDLGRYVRSRLDCCSDTQREVLLHLALSYFYGQKAIQGQFFAELLRFPASKLLNLGDYLPQEACDLLLVEESGAWRPCHYLIAEEMLKQLLTWPEAPGGAWHSRLSAAAIDFARFVHDDEPSPSDEALDLMSRVFVYRDSRELLGTQSTVFAPIIHDIPVTEGRRSVLEEVVKLFPDESHFWAHLGRFYSIEAEDFDAALDALSRALELQGGTDSVLHHMRGMVIRSSMYAAIERREPIEDVAALYERAAESFRDAREHDAENDYGYISQIQAAVKLVRYAAGPDQSPLVAAANSRIDVVRGATDVAEGLLADLRAARATERPSDYELQCRAQLDELYGNYTDALQQWDSLLTAAESGRADVPVDRVRRQIVWTYLARADHDWSRLSQREIDRSISLVENSLRTRPDARDLKIWIRGVRFMEAPPSVDSAVERVFYWNGQSPSVESAYYLYVLRALQLIEAPHMASVGDVERAIEECRSQSRFRRRRQGSPEWLGRQAGLRALVAAGTLGDWDQEAGFFANAAPLRRVTGRISKILGPQAGTITLDSGLEAFFTPARSGHSKGRSENQLVGCFLGFSFDGPRAWSVEDAT